MSIEYIKGDMVKAIEDCEQGFFVHGCNCFHTMGSGIARQLREAYPELFQIDLETEYEMYDKLGTFSALAITDNKIIFNLYTQYNYGTDKVYLNYPALRLGLNKLNWLALEAAKEVGVLPIINMPKIGCGLAGGDWNIVKQIIEEEFDESITVNVWIKD